MNLCKYCKQRYAVCYYDDGGPIEIDACDECITPCDDCGWYTDLDASIERDEQLRRDQLASEGIIGIMTARDIPGWNHDIDPWAEWIAPRIPKGGTYLEIGVFLGASLAKMGELRPDINLVAVDPWIDAAAPGWIGVEESIFKHIVREHGSLFLAFVANMKAHAPDVLRRTRVVQGTARNVELPVASVDMLFIDGAHDYVSVTADLCTFGPCVRSHGIVSGHDYDHAGVRQAVDEYFGERPNVGIAGEGVCWWA